MIFQLSQSHLCSLKFERNTLINFYDEQGLEITLILTEVFALIWPAIQEISIDRCSTGETKKRGERKVK